MSNIKRNYLYNLIYQVLAIIIPFVTTPYVSRILGAEGIGAYSYTYGIVSYFAIFAATGTVNFGNREIAKLQKNKHERSVMFWQVWLFRLICTAVVTVAYCLFVFVYSPQYKVLYIIHFFTVLSWIVDISWYFQGMEDFKVTAVRNSMIKIVGTVLVFVFVKQHDDVWMYTLIFCSTIFLGNASMWSFMKKEVERVSFAEISLLPCVKPIMGLFLPVIAIQIYNVLNKTMLGSMNSVAEVGYYAQAEKIIQMVLTIISSVVGVLMPRIAALYKQHDIRQVSKYYHKAIDYIFLLSLPSIAGLWAVADIFVPIFFGPGFDAVVLLLHVLSALFIILTLGQLFGVFLIAMDKQNQYTIAVSVAAVVNLILNAALIFRFGSVGVSISTLIAEFGSTAIQGWYIRHLLDLKYIGKAFLHYLIPAVIMFAVVLGLKQLPLASLPLLAVCVVGGAVVYGGYLLISKDDFVYSILKIKKKKRGRHM